MNKLKYIIDRGHCRLLSATSASLTLTMVVLMLMLAPMNSALATHVLTGADIQDIEAENADASTISGDGQEWRVVTPANNDGSVGTGAYSTDDASGNSFIESLPDLGNRNTDPGTARAIGPTVTYNIEVPSIAEAGNYGVFIRSAVKDSNSDTYWIYVNGVPGEFVDHDAEDAKFVFQSRGSHTFNVGINTIEITIREDGNAIDLIRIAKPGKFCPNCVVLNPDDRCVGNGNLVKGFKLRYMKFDPAYLDIFFPHSGDGGTIMMNAQEHLNTPNSPAFLSPIDHAASQEIYFSGSPVTIGSPFAGLTGAFESDIHGGDGRGNVFSLRAQGRIFVPDGSPKFLTARAPGRSIHKVKIGSTTVCSDSIDCSFLQDESLNGEPGYYPIVIDFAHSAFQEILQITQYSDGPEVGTEYVVNRDGNPDFVVEVFRKDRPEDTPLGQTCQTVGGKN